MDEHKVKKNCRQYEISNTKRRKIINSYQYEIDPAYAEANVQYNSKKTPCHIRLLTFLNCSFCTTNEVRALGSKKNTKFGYQPVSFITA